VKTCWTHSKKIPLKPGSERPAKPVKITDIIIYQDPFEEYKKRQEKRRARKAQAEEEARSGIKVEKKDNDDMNWFGTKLGEGGHASKGLDVGGVGKYLNLKRPMESAAPVGGQEESQKKRRVGFGDFEGW